MDSLVIIQSCECFVNEKAIGKKKHTYPLILTLINKQQLLAWFVRYAVYLAIYDYEIKYNNTTKHCNADGMSRMPVPEVRVDHADPDDLMHLLQLDTLPITSAQICKEYTMKGWPHSHDSELSPFQTHGGMNFPYITDALCRDYAS